MGPDPTQPDLSILLPAVKGAFLPLTRIFLTQPSEIFLPDVKKMGFGGKYSRARGS